MSNHSDIHHLAAAYALDAVDEQERAEFEAHYPSCDVCRADVLAFRNALGRLAAADPVPPPPAVRDRVLADIARTRQLSPLLGDDADELDRRRRRRRAAAAVLAAAAAVIAVVAGAVLLATDRPTFGDELAAVVEQPDARFATLTGTDAGSVRVVWSDEANRAVVLGDGLPPAPDGQAYELWLIDENGPIPMDVLDDAGDGTVRAAIELDAEPTAWGVTIEPEAGSPAPTGEILFVATV